MNNKKRGSTSRSVLYLTRGAIVAALYVALTYAAMPISSGVIQFRISEMLCILPVFMPEAIVGLFIGCLLSNLLMSAVVWDVVFGSIATLIGAVGAFLLRKLPKSLMWLSSLPTIIANVVIIPPVLIYAYGATEAFPFLMMTVGIGELVCAGVGGAVLYYSLQRTKIFSK